MLGATTRHSDKFLLRMPDGMRELIRKQAEKNRRSMTAEIVLALNEKFEAEDRAA